MRSSSSSFITLALSLSLAGCITVEGGAPGGGGDGGDGDPGTPGLPQTFSFKNDVEPMFTRRGCDACHSGKEIGKDLGGLDLDGKNVYQEVTREVSDHYRVLRVDGRAPEASLMLTLPLAENPPDSHPNATFLTTDDPDYLLLLAWIEEGALDN
jgi:hypothetical protein